MNARRCLLHACMVLVLLIQGQALAAAQAATPQPMPQETVAAASQAPEASAVPPCHGGAAAVAVQDAPAPEAPTHGCCDTGCPDMLGCLLGHLAAAPQQPPMPVPQAVFIAAAADSFAPARLPTRLLRPPIPLHG